MNEPFLPTPCPTASPAPFMQEGFYGLLADHIMEDLPPGPVLDAGCGQGGLVAALRERGAEAFGVEPSSRLLAGALQEAAPYLRPYPQAGESWPGGLPETFGLVICLHLLHRLNEEEAEETAARLCALSGSLLVACTAPGPQEDEETKNPGGMDYWAKRLARQGFFRLADYTPPAILPGAVLFTRQQDATLPRLAEQYERALRKAEARLLAEAPAYTALAMFNFGQGFTTEGMLQKTSRDTAFSWIFTLPAGAREIQFTPAAGQRCVVGKPAVLLAGQRVAACCPNGAPLHGARALLKPGEPLRARVELPPGITSCQVEIRAEIFLLEGHPSLLEAFSALMGEDEPPAQPPPAPPPAGARQKLKGLVRRVCLALPGLRSVYTRKAAERMFGREEVAFNLKHYGRLEGFPNPFVPSRLQAEEQKTMHFSPEIKFSVVSPLYNTPEGYLRQMLQSVVGQTYANWELCLVDASGPEHSHVERTVRQFMRRDGRIRYQRLAKNEGISGNTNAAIAMATGDYIGLLDHDDLLNINALFEVRRAIAHTQADFVYSDECTFAEDHLERINHFHFKPGYGPDTLRTNNYICHFSVFKKSLLEEAGGGFRSEYDGSQDFDMVLRLTEKAKTVAHVHKLLYFWRSHGGSVASNISAKPYAAQSAKNAIAAQLARLGLKGKAEEIPGLVNIYKINYEIEGTPLISILIPSRDRLAALKRCLGSIREKSSYPNYEVLVVDCGSRQPATHAFYGELEETGQARILRPGRPLNSAAALNLAAGQAAGEMLLCLHADTEVLSENWMQEMLMFAQRPDVGAAGGKLYFPDDTLQHAGYTLGLCGAAACFQAGSGRKDPGYMSTLFYTRNVTGVSAACMMLRRELFLETGGFNEQFALALYDMDLCLRLRQKGLLNVLTPYAELYHSTGRGGSAALAGVGSAACLQPDAKRLRALWELEFRECDPYFNQNFDPDSTPLSFRILDQGKV